MSISADGIATLLIFNGRADRSIFAFTVLYMRPYISFYTDIGMGYISELMAHISVYGNGIVSPCPCGGYRSGCIRFQGKVRSQSDRPLVLTSPAAISQTTALIGQFTPSSRLFSTRENRLDNSVRCPHKAKPLSSLRRPPKLLNRLRNDRQVSQSG